MVIIGKECPSFTAKMIWNHNISIITEQDLKGHYTLFFFYAVDFSLVCPTEVYALQNSIEEFKKRDVDIIAISIDSVYTHAAWLRTPKEKGGIEGVSFKMVSDITQSISKSFGVYDDKQALSLRGSFLIDPQLTIQYGAVNNMAFGRSVAELLRAIDAVQFVTIHGISCPANWQAGQEGIKTIF
ncbi:MAG: peroxiredoxin [Candidatus Babeliaceae bacterium]|jgi:peroxiredoxin (alkyl hydroperoxide reductase subunit C)